MKLVYFLPAILLLLQGIPAAAQPESKLQDGDFLFLDLDCGGLCDAIEAVTEGAAGRDFSHLGLVRIKGDTIRVLEAMGNSVRETALRPFLGYTAKPALLARLKPDYRHLIPGALSFAAAQKGIPYDDAFLPDNGKYYCSELVYDAFREANSGRPFFQLEQMTFKKPGGDVFFPVWEEYYQKLGIAIPEGKPGCNPGGISRSAFLEILGEFSINPEQAR